MKHVFGLVTRLLVSHRYSLSSQGAASELKVDLLFLFHHLQEVAGAAGQGSSLPNIRQVFSSEGFPGEKLSSVLQDIDGDAWGDGVLTVLPALDLSLVLHCSRVGVGVPCEGVHLLHPPFTTLFYR